MLLGAAPAWAQYQAKINDIRVISDGTTEIYATVLDPYGLPPQIEQLERITINFGEANEFSGDEIQVQLFKDSGQGTDYVIILPAYEGFGISNAVAAAQGAGVFQATHVGETDSCMFFLYGDGVLPFEGEAGELAVAFREPDGVARVARPYMLSAIDEAVRYYDGLEPGRRRIIILVGTGLDVRLSDANQVELPPGATGADYDNARRQVIDEHEAILRRYVEALDNVHARLFAVGYNDFRVDYLEVLKVLSRKSGGTYRRVANIGDFAAAGGGTGVFNWIGEELANELIIRPPFNAEGGREYEVWATFRFPDPESQQVLEEIITRPYILTVQEFETRLNIIPYLIVIGIILIVAFLLVVVLFFMSKRLKKERTAIAERKKLEDKVAAGKPFCPTCYRRMQPDWQQCLFCASGMPPLEEKPKEMLEAEEAKKKLVELDGKPAAPELVVGTVAAVAFYATREGKPTCKTCGRVVDPAWKECMFCAAGLPPLPEMAVAAPVMGPVAAPVAGSGLAPAAAPAGGGPAPAAKGAASGGGEVKTIAITPGVTNCPKCGRPVPPDWKECLYCKAGV